MKFVAHVFAALVVGAPLAFGGCSVATDDGASPGSEQAPDSDTVASSAESLRLPRRNGSLCSTNSDCLSGICAGGTCCGTACDTAPGCKYSRLGDAQVSRSCATGTCVTTETLCGYAACTGGKCLSGSCTTDAECSDLATCGALLHECTRAACSGDADCQAGYTCDTFKKRCGYTCGPDSPCAVGYACSSGACLSMCSDDSTCQPGSSCTSGLCLPRTCAQRSDCSGDSFCRSGRCLPLPPCRTAQDCWGYPGMTCVNNLCR